MAKVSPNQRHGNTRRDQFFKSFVTVLAGPRRDYEAIGSVISKRIESLHIFLRRVFANADEESVATFLQHLSHSSTQLRRKRIRDITDHQTNGLRSLALQTTRQAIAAVLHLAGYLQNTFASFHANVASTVNDARNCHWRDRRQTGYIGQRHLSFGLFLHALAS